MEREPNEGSGGPAGIQRRTVLASVGASLGVSSQKVLAETSEISAKTRAETPDHFGSEQIEDARVDRTLITKLVADELGVLNEPNAKYLTLKLSSPPQDKRNPRAEAFELVTRDGQFRPVSDHLRIEQGRGEYITNTVRTMNTPEGIAPRPEAYSCVSFKLPRETTLIDGSISVGAQPSFEYSLNRVLSDDGAVGDPIDLNRVRFPEQIGTESYHTVEFDVTNPGSRPSVFHAGVNVSGPYNSATAVEFEVPAGEQSTEQVEIPNAILSDRVLSQAHSGSGQIEAVTSSGVTRQHYR